MATNDKSPFSAAVQGVAERLKLGSVTDVFVAVLIVLGSILCISLFSGNNWIPIGIFTLICLTLAAWLIAYFYLLNKDPDKLRPSEHEIRKMELAVGLGETNKVLPEIVVDALPDITAQEEEKKGGK